MGYGYGWKRRSKYGSIKVQVDGHTFDSKSEADFYHVLKLQEKQGNIALLELQPKVYMTKARILLKPDFKIMRDGEIIFIDVKGFQTPEFNLKARLWKHYGPGTLQVIKKAGQRFIVQKEIIALREGKDESDNKRSANTNDT